MQLIKVMILTYLIIKNEPTKSSCSTRKIVEKVVNVKKDVEDSDNIDGWEDNDLLLRSWISCNLEKERTYMIVGCSTPWKKLIFKQYKIRSFISTLTTKC